MSWERYHQADILIHSYSSIIEIIWENSECMCGFVFHLHVCVVMCVCANVEATDQRLSSFIVLHLTSEGRSPSKPGVLQSSYTGSAENSQDPHFSILMPYHKHFTQSHPPVSHLEISLDLIHPIKHKIISSGSHHSWLESSGYLAGLYNDHS